MDKQQHVADALEHIGGSKGLTVLPIVGSDEIFYYRNKLEFSFSDKRWLTEKDMDAIPVVEGKVVSPDDEESDEEQKVPMTIAAGFHVPQRWDKVLDIRECFLMSEMSSGILNTVREFGVKDNIPAFSRRMKRDISATLSSAKGRIPAM